MKSESLERKVCLSLRTTDSSPWFGGRICEIGAFGIEPAFTFHRVVSDLLPLDELMAQLKGSELIVFDAMPCCTERFLAAELERAGWPSLSTFCSRVTNAWDLAYGLFADGCLRLDWLCEHFGIDSKETYFTGALLDAWRIAQIYQRLQSDWS